MKKGVASCRGAISILNAIPTGIGASMGITLQTDAEVIITDGKPRISVNLEEIEEDDILAKECVHGVIELLSKKLQNISIRTRSTIPVSRGLKSSSAAANAISLATLRALDSDLDDIELVKLGVKAAKRAEVTVTGAFDDATACYFGGISVTDNTSMKIIQKSATPGDHLKVILHVPEQKIRKKGISKATFSSMFDDFKKVEKLVRDAKYFDAITENGRLIAKALGINNDISKRALKAGALAAGISGTGPATSIIVDRHSFNNVLDEVSCEDAVIIVASPNDTPAPEVKPRL